MGTFRYGLYLGYSRRTCVHSHVKQFTFTGFSKTFRARQNEIHNCTKGLNKSLGDALPYDSSNSSKAESDGVQSIQTRKPGLSRISKISTVGSKVHFIRNARPVHWIYETFIRHITKCWWWRVRSMILRTVNRYRAQWTLRISTRPPIIHVQGTIKKPVVFNYKFSIADMLSAPKNDLSCSTPAEEDKFKSEVSPVGAWYWKMKPPRRLQ